MQVGNKKKQIEKMKSKGKTLVIIRNKKKQI